MKEFLALQKSRRPDNIYDDGAILSWNIVARGFQGTTGIVQPGFRGEFDIPSGGEQVRLLRPEDEERIGFDILGQAGVTVESLMLEGHGMVFVPEGRDRLWTPESQAAVGYLCIYPGRPV